MLPNHLLADFFRIYAEALADADNGHVFAGYCRLVQRLSEAKASEDPWAERLATLWETALERYRKHYSIDGSHVSN